MTRTLIVTAVEAERIAVLDGLGDIGRAIDIDQPSVTGHTVDVMIGGVGPASAAARTAAALVTAKTLGCPYHVVVSMGIGGGFAGRAAIGEIVVATASIAADLGAQTPDGFAGVDQLGFGSSRIEAHSTLVASAKPGAILTVSTVTGTSERAAELADRHPDALAEAMEGYGVACAAAAVGVGFAEVRTISNVVGPRDRAAWRIPAALAALTKAAAAIAAESRRT